MKQVLMISSEDALYQVGVDGVDAIHFWDEQPDGTRIYRVFKGREVIYVQSKRWKETAQLGFF